jgi:glycosyltransferase involved in cell wall biosynthesis
LRDVNLVGSDILRISGVTPNFNMGAYLPSTIGSVLANLGPRDEYFIIDGGSSDGSVKAIEACQGQLAGWVSERDSGYAEAISKGFSRATGDICCWINSGDLLLAGAFDHVRRHFAETEATFIFGDDFYIDENDRVLAYSRGWVTDLKMAMLYGGWTPLQDACFWRRDLYAAVGGIDVSLKYAADYDLFLRMAMGGAATYVPFAFSAFRRHAGQKSICGAENYAAEKEAARQRQLAKDGRSPLSTAVKSFLETNRMRVRARVAPRLWSRADLADKPIANLACAAYWPPENQI